MFYKIIILAVVAARACQSYSFLDDPRSSDESRAWADNLSELSVSWGFRLEGAYHFSTGNDIMIRSRRGLPPMSDEDIAMMDDTHIAYLTYTHTLEKFNEHFKHNVPSDNFFQPRNISLQESIACIDEWFDRERSQSSFP